MNEFKEITPKEIAESPLKLIGDDWMLVTAGDKEKFNTMILFLALVCPIVKRQFQV